MPDDERQHKSDTPRPSATNYSLTLDEVARLFAGAGLPRNIRSLQRYCAAGRLDCIKEETATGLAYFVDPASVERAITQLAQLHGITDEVRHGAPQPDMSHRDAPPVEPKAPIDTPRLSAAERDTVAPEYQEHSSPVAARHVAPCRPPRNRKRIPASADRREGHADRRALGKGQRDQFFDPRIADDAGTVAR